MLLQDLHLGLLILPKPTLVGFLKSYLIEKAKLNQYSGSFYLVQRKNCHSSNLIFRPCTYPSIGPEFLNRAINFARTKCDISDHEIDIILHCPKTFLFNNGDPWIKKGEKENFDVPMGSYHGAEQCELVGLYLLYLMTTCKNR